MGCIREDDREEYRATTLLHGASKTILNLTWQKLRNWLWTWGGIEDWKPLFPSMGVFVGTVDNYNTSVFTMAMNWTSFKSQKPSTRRVISTITIAIFWDDWGPLTSTGRCSGCYISQLWSVLSVLSMLWCAWKEPESSGHQQTQVCSIGNIVGLELDFVTMSKLQSVLDHSSLWHLGYFLY